MTRAFFIVAVLMTWSAIAHADATEIHVELTDVTIYGDGDWGMTSRDGGWEFWRNADGDIRKEVTLGFSPAIAGRCSDWGGGEISDEYAFDGATTVFDMGVSNGMRVINVCTEVGDAFYIMAIALPGSDSTVLMAFYAPINGMMHSYIGQLEARAVPAVVADPTSEPATGGATWSDSGPSAPAEPEPTRTTSQAFWHWLPPHTIVGGVIHRSGGSDDAGYGGGVTLAHLPWRAGRHRGIGYEVSVAGAKDWWTLSAQVRPAVSAGSVGATEDADRGLQVDLYLALGVDGTGGDLAPSVGFAPVAGPGLDVVLFTPAASNAIFGLDAGVQVLADPSGMHSYTMSLGFDVGGAARRMRRLGVAYVDHGTAGAVLWLTVGVSDLSGRR